MPVKPSIDPAQALWNDYQQKVAAWEAAGTPVAGESVAAMDEAEERFIEHRTTTPLGILLKLEHIVDTDNMAKRPHLTTSRLAMGMLRDLRSTLPHS
ncbi:MAG: hypothetical protein J0J01_19850 [Reyranella sp.]|uniref:hypothetical protein n=1 Tax=Reyranella sp. TaxID=1929291 RepID=UPI001AC9D95E|nr:hypothetical protein [Reyranella sp.]MBN9089166.1 hypothetical protein [Reyranella sp.]